MRPSFLSEPVRVRVPATSANLGPGFDTLGLALALYDDVSARVAPAGCHVDVTGQGAGELPTDDGHLVVRAMRATFDLLGGQPTGLAVECVNRIPQARGLGSSSAAIVAGVTLARALVVDGDQRFDDAAVLRLAAELEGHPDNVAPCLLGGFTIAWTAGPQGSDGAGGAGAGGGAGACRLEVAPGVQPTVLVPDERGLTSEARAALPAVVPHADAARNAGRAALLVHALTAAPELLFTATEDRLHQDYRAPGMPATAAVLAGLRAAGVAAVVSGAGPTILALTSIPDEHLPGMGWAAQRLAVDVAGARVDRGRLGHAERDPVAAGRKS
ncbi:homoserine kinase [Plantactinospora sp. B5E13]|uniref:homoserine kinase n=1 Tax=Plantactinospora sp. B5E13 TaxID=3153758 RepID=UPI00325D3D45